MPDINATAPVTLPASDSMVYDKWYMSSLSFKSTDAKSGRTIISLRRANKTGDVWTLMPNEKPEAEVSFALDIYKEMATTPELGVAFSAVLEAVIAYATKNNKL